MRPFFRRFSVGLAAGLAMGLLVDLPYVVVLIFGIFVGLAVGLRVWLDAPADVTRAPSPATALRQDRTATLAFGLMFALMFGLCAAILLVWDETRRIPSELVFKLPWGLSYGLPAGLAGAIAGALGGSLVYGRMSGFIFSLACAITAGFVVPPVDTVSGIAFGVAFGLAVGSAAMLAKAWGAFVLSRFWLALFDRQPWGLMKFLADAHRRGILRQVGGVYQFRHARLQDHLAEPARTRHTTQHIGST